MLFCRTINIIMLTDLLNEPWLGLSGRLIDRRKSFDLIVF